MFSFIFSISSILYLRIITLYKKFLLKKKNLEFNRKNLNNWMNLTKKERYSLSKSDSNNYLNRRKDLLDKIRKEYKIIKK